MPTASKPWSGPNIFIRTDLHPGLSAWKFAHISRPLKLNSGAVSTVNFNRGRKQILPLEATSIRGAKRMPLPSFKFRGKEVVTNMLIDLPFRASESLEIKVESAPTGGYFKGFICRINTPQFNAMTRRVVTIEDSDGKTSFDGKNPSTQLAAIDLKEIIGFFVDTDIKHFATRLLNDLQFLRGNLGITFTPAANVTLFNEQTLSYFSWLSELKKAEVSQPRINEFREMFEAKHGMLHLEAKVHQISIATGVLDRRLVGSVIL